MADLNALIAQGVQFQKPVNPFVQYGQMQQLQQNEQANQLNQMKMQEMQRGMEETNAMRRLDPNSESYLADITRISPEKGFAFGKMRQEAKTAGTEGQIKDTKLIADKLALLPDAYRMADTPEAYLALHQSVHADPVLGPYLKSLGATPEKGMATLQNAVQTGKFNELRMGSMQSVSQILEGMKTQPDAALMKQLGYPQTPAGYEAFRQAQRAEPRERLLTQEEEAQKTRIALASRPAPQARVEPAPTVATIQDPTNPNQMISINARDYRGGGIGSPGVIGLTGKTPAATAKQDAVDKGYAQLSSVLDDLRASYDTLDKAAAIPSTQRGVLSNLASSAQASGLGQAMGRMGGTEEQSARDTINSSRMMLLNSIKQATGMSAQQLNSNVELKSWLQAVSDPTQSIETVNKVLGNIEKFVESGGKYSAKKASAPATGGPNIDALLNKYK